MIQDRYLCIYCKNLVISIQVTFANVDNIEIVIYDEPNKKIYIIRKKE